ncbi:MAG: hypothetical protein CMN96_09870 [Synechococcus sp. MED850]|jgi:hypothetical protein|nr:hypothetical protein [Synechococcus sp. MED850]
MAWVRLALKLRLIGTNVIMLEQKLLCFGVDVSRLGDAPPLQSFCDTALDSVALMTALDD